MARKPLRPCRHPGCFRLTSSGWCAEHQPEASQQTDRKSDAASRRTDRRSEEAKQRHKLYNTKRWLVLRADQLLREPFCRECAKRGERVYATDVDHIRPHGGDRALFYDPGNLQSLCHACHSAKTWRENQDNLRRTRR